MTLSFNNARSNVNSDNQLVHPVISEQEIDRKNEQELVNEETKIIE